MKRKILFLICLIIFIVSIAGVSAAEDANQTVSDTLSVSQSDGEILESADGGTFSDLQKKIDEANESAVINLENDYKYDGSVDSGEITINKALTINGNGYTIDGNNEVRIFNIVSANVVLNNISFINGYSGSDAGSIYAQYSNLTLMDCYFTNCRIHNYDPGTYHGGAIYLDEGTLSVEGSIFEGNGIYSESSSIYGGAIYVDGDCVLIDSSFYGNYLSYETYNCGGAIYSTGNVTCINSIISQTSSYGTGNSGTAIHSEASVLIINSNFIGNTFKEYNVNSIVGGGVIYANSVDVYNSTFANNSIKGEYAWGGVIYADSVNVHNSDFINNIAQCAVSYVSGYSAGAAIYANTINVNNSKFINNIAKYGGRTSPGVTISSYGGAIRFFNRLSSINSTFINNSAANGDAIYGYVGFMTDIKSTFINNTYTLVKQSPNLSLTLSNKVVNVGENVQLNITFNNAISDGVIVYVNSIKQDTNISDGCINLILYNVNESTYTILVEFLGDERFIADFTSSSFRVVDESYLSFSDLQEIIDNANDGDTIDLLNNFIYGLNNEDETIVIKKGLTINGNGHSIDGNKEVQIFSIGSANVVLNNISFINGYSENDYGGAVSGSDNLIVVNCSFDDCSAYRGGAVSGAGSVVDCSFVSCSADYSGAVSGAGSVVDCSFVSCSADYGGAVSGAGSVVDCSFVDCSAGDGGGAINIGSGSIVNCIFVNCSAEYGGAVDGGSVYYSSSLNVSGCSFVDCSANHNGGGIYSVNTDLRIINTTFINCSPDDYYPSDVYIENTTISSHININLDKTAVYVSDSIQINITLDEGATGDVIVSIGGVNETLTLTNSSASLIKSNLAVGTYDVVVRYLGDDKFSPYAKSSSFKVADSTFKDLQALINNLTDGEVLNLDKNYTYVKSMDPSSPISIRKNNIIINGNGYTIDGDKKVQIFSIGSANVVLNNISFINGYSVEDFFSSGGAVSGYDNLIVVNCSFDDCYARGRGGAVSGSGSVVNCSFVDCSSNIDGGAVYSSGSLNISGCSFVDCSARTDGGAICSVGSVVDCSFVDCSAWNGGAVYGAGSVINSTFTNCHAGGGSGGAIDGVNSIINSTFMDCYTSLGYGGAICNVGNLNVSGSTFINNKAAYGPYSIYPGGAIYCRYGVVIYDDSSIFKDNEPDDIYNVDIPNNLIIALNTTVIYENASIKVDISFTNEFLGILKDISGIIKVNVSGNEQEVTLVDGAASFVLSNLSVGDYNLTVSYGKNSYSYNERPNRYAYSTNSTTFTVVDSSCLSFTDLQELIDNATNKVDNGLLGADNNVPTVDLNNNYIYGLNPNDKTIVIDESVTINGNGYSLLGNDMADMIIVNAENVVLNNLTFTNTTNCVINSSAKSTAVKGSVFKDNDNYLIWFAGDDSVIDNSLFVNNTAEEGSLIYIAGNNSEISNSVFKDNDGELLSASDDVEVLLENNTGLYEDISLEINAPSNIEAGSVLFIELYLNYDSSGNVSVIVGVDEYIAKFTQGYANLSVSDLKYGNYDIVANFTNSFVSVTNSTNVSVNKKDSGFYCYDQTIPEGTNATISVHFDYDDVTGNIAAIVDGKIYSVIVDGSLYWNDITLPALNIGNYNVVVVYSGDEKYNSANKTIDIYVQAKKNITLDIFAGSITEGDDAIINVILPDDASGTVTVNINGNNYSNTTYGKASIIIPGLTSGNYIANVYYSGDEWYNGANGSVAVRVIPKDVPKKNVTMEAHAKDIRQYFYPATIYVVLPSDAGGSVSINFNDKNYSSTVVRGKASITISYISIAGNYTIPIVYSGDGLYNGANGSVVLKVIPYWDPYVDVTMNLSANPITEGETAVINVILPSDADGSVSAYINGTSFGYGTVINGNASISIPGLASGNYTFSVNYWGDPIYASTSGLVNVTVNPKSVTPKEDLNPNIKVNPVTVGEDVVIIVSDLADATGNVTATVNDKTYAAPIKDGKATITIPGLTENATVTVSYPGDDKYNNFTESVDIVVNPSPATPKENLTIGATASPITVGENATIIVTGLKDATGNVSARVGNGIYFAPINDGKATISVSGLMANDTALINYLGDDKYDEANTTVDIIVNPAPVTPKEDLNVSIEANPVTAGEDAVIKVSGLEDATGEVTAEVNGKTYNAPIKDGKATITVPGLTENATVTVSYPGDDKYNNFTESVDIVVNPSPVTPKENLTLKATSSPITVGEDAIITVTGLKDATGNVSARVGNGVYFAPIKDGKATITVSGLTANDTALINYLGDDKYNEASTSVDIVVNPISTNTALSFAVNGNNATLTAVVSPATATGEVIFTVNGKNYTAEIVNSKAIYTLANLKADSYVASAVYKGDATHKSSVSNDVAFNITDDYVVITAPDVEKYYHGPERFVITLTDSKGKPITNASVSITINGNTYTRVTDDKGVASMAINLNSGVYDVTTKYNVSEVLSTVTIKATVSGENITKMFRNGTQYYATFVDTSGKTLANNTAVEFNINGVFYTRYTNEKGVARMNINLNPGEYIITAKNPNSTEMYTNIITVLPTIVENYNLTKYYKNASQYVIRILDEKGNPVGAGVDVKFNINGVFYTRTSNATGHVKMNINLEPGEYTITAEYNGLMASNTIKVLSVIETKNLNMKYKDGSKFNATILDGQGKPYPGQKVTFNINGVFYERMTDETGVAHLNINLMAGEYIITTSYNGMNAANKVTITS